MAQRYMEGVVRTNKLRCGDCDDKIKKGDNVIFDIDDCEVKPMQNVYCVECSKNYEVDDQHPFDID